MHATAPSLLNLRNGSLVLLLLFSILATLSARPVKIHILPHSHVDEGWKLSFEDYQPLVNSILKSSIDALLEDSRRKFIWSETSYFQIWWEKEKDKRYNSTHTYKDAVLGLIHNTKQLEYVGGGWVQHDEAQVHYESMINQMTVGLNYVKEQLGVTPRVAWQNDVFGHSAITPFLFSQMGFESVVLNRIHSHIKQRMREEKKLEFYWRDPLNKDTKVFAHVLYKHYNPPRGFDFENSFMSEDQVPDMTTRFLSYIDQMSEHYVTDNILFIWGDDFKFSNAERQFKSMQLIMDYIASNPGISSQYSVQFSTISEYLDSVYAWEKGHGSNQGREAPEFQNLFEIEAKDYRDFFPYTDSFPFDFWSGFYTLRPDVKRKLKIAEYHLRSAELLFSSSVIKLTKVLTSDTKALLFPSENVEQWIQKTNKNLEIARQNVGLLQHHDAITGTHKNFVHDSYIYNLKVAHTSLQQVIHDSLTILLNKKWDFPGSPMIAQRTVFNHYHDQKHQNLFQHAIPQSRPQYSQKQLQPEVRALSFENKDTVPMVVMNTLSWTRKEFVEIIIKAIDRDVLVTDASGNAIESQLVPLILNHFGSDRSTTQKQDDHQHSKFTHNIQYYTLVFEVELPPYAMRTIYIKQNFKRPPSNHLSSTIVFTNNVPKTDTSSSDQKHAHYDEYHYDLKNDPAANDPTAQSAPSSAASSSLNDYVVHPFSECTEHIELSSEKMTAVFHRSSGELLFVKSTGDGKEETTFKVVEQLAHYRPLTDAGWFSSGQYIFRINWGIWLLIGSGIGYVAGLLVGVVLYGLWLILLKVAGLFIKRSPPSKPALSPKDLNRKEKFRSYILFGALLAISIILVHSTHNLLPAHLHDYVYHSMPNFGLPFGAVAGLTFYLLGGVKRGIFLAVVFFLTYQFALYAAPWTFAHSLFLDQWHQHKQEEPSPTQSTTSANAAWIVHKGPLVQQFVKYYAITNVPAKPKIWTPAAKQPETILFVHQVQVLKGKDYLDMRTFVLPDTNHEVVYQISSPQIYSNAPPPSYNWKSKYEGKKEQKDHVETGAESHGNEKSFTPASSLLFSKLFQDITESNFDRQEMFFTDVNDLFMLNRKYRSTMPTQASYYPVSSTVSVVEFNHKQNREQEHQVVNQHLTVLTSQPVGATAYQGNKIEFMLHRRPTSDDERGLEQVIKDTFVSDVRFHVYLQRSKAETAQGLAMKHRNGQVPSLMQQEVLPKESSIDTQIFLDPFYHSSTASSPSFRLQKSLDLQHPFLIFEGDLYALQTGTSETAPKMRSSGSMEDESLWNLQFEKETKLFSQKFMQWLQDNHMHLLSFQVSAADIDKIEVLIRIQSVAPFVNIVSKDKFLEQVRNCDELLNEKHRELTRANHQQDQSAAGEHDTAGQIWRCSIDTNDLLLHGVSTTAGKRVHEPSYTIWVFKLVIEKAKHM